MASRARPLPSSRREGADQSLIVLSKALLSVQFRHMSYLVNIIRQVGNGNLAGIISIKVARKVDIVSIPAPSKGTIYGDIVFQFGKAWSTWDVILESPRAKSNDQATREGTSKKNTLGFMIPKDRPEIQNMLLIATEDEFVVLFTDSNGKQKIFGDLQAPVRFGYDHDSGAQFSNLNGYACQFYYDGPDNRYFYDGAVSVAPAGPPPAIVKVNGEVIASLEPGEEIDFDTAFDFTFAIVGT